MTPPLIEKEIKNIHIVINPASGKNEPVLALISEALKDSGIVCEMLITQKSGDGLRHAKNAVKEGVDAVVVYGGDGTIMEVAEGLIGTEIPLAILPGGSANVLANELNIPKDLKEALALLCHSPREIRVVDVGRCNDRLFITGISLGFSADLVKGADRKTKNKFGLLAYFFSAASALQRLKLVRYHLKIDGKEYDVKGLTCVVNNAGNLGFTKISLDKHIDISDGLLDVLIVKKADPGLFKMIFMTLLTRERPDNYALVNHWQGKDISVASNQKQILQCDGEVLKQAPLRIKIIPAALKILVPKK